MGYDIHELFNDCVEKCVEVEKDLEGKDYTYYDLEKFTLELSKKYQLHCETKVQWLLMYLIGSIAEQDDTQEIILIREMLEEDSWKVKIERELCGYKEITCTKEEEE